MFLEFVDFEPKVILKLFIKFCDFEHLYSHGLYSFFKI